MTIQDCLREVCLCCTEGPKRLFLVHVLNRCRDLVYVPDQSHLSRAVAILPAAPPALFLVWKMFCEVMKLSRRKSANYSVVGHAQAIDGCGCGVLYYYQSMRYEYFLK